MNLATTEDRITDLTCTFAEEETGLALAFHFAQEWHFHDFFGSPSRQDIEDTQAMYTWAEVPTHVINHNKDGSKGEVRIKGRWYPMD